MPKAMSYWYWLFWRSRQEDLVGGDFLPRRSIYFGRDRALRGDADFFR